MQVTSSFSSSAYDRTCTHQAARYLVQPHRAITAILRSDLIEAANRFQRLVTDVNRHNLNHLQVCLDHVDISEAARFRR